MTKKTAEGTDPGPPVPDYTFAGYVDLDVEDVREPDGTRLTEARAQEIVEEVRRGRPALGHRRCKRGNSPQITVRLTEATREKAAQRAEAEERRSPNLPAKRSCDT